MPIKDKRSWQRAPSDLKKILASQLNQTAPAPTQADLKPPPCSARKAYEHALILPAEFHPVADLNDAEPPFAS